MKSVEYWNIARPSNIGKDADLIKKLPIDIRMAIIEKVIDYTKRLFDENFLHQVEETITNLNCLFQMLNEQRNFSSSFYFLHTLFHFSHMLRSNDQNVLWFAINTEAEHVHSWDNGIYYSTIEINNMLQPFVQYQNDWLFPLFVPIEGWENSWKTLNTFQLARSICVEKAYDRLPILADALMDEGCEHEEVMAVLKSNSPYFCNRMWILDKLNHE